MNELAPISALKTTRLLGLDLLRLLAIVLVVGRHMETPPDDIPLKGVWDAWHDHGGLGVDVFFVLSGFLVSGLLFAECKKHGDISVKRFYMRRAWKIYPPFYFLMAFSYVFQLVAGQKIRDRTIFSELFFLRNYRGGFWNHTWTLAVEEHFYLILPLLLLFSLRRNCNAKDPFRAVPYLVAGSMLLFLLVRILNFSFRSPYSYLTHVFATHLRIDALFFGVAMAYGYYFHNDWFRKVFRPQRYGLILLGVGLLGSSLFLGSSSSFYIHTFGFMQFYLGAAAILAGVLMCEIPRNRLTTALAAIGAYSYSIYLWHMALMYWAMPSLRSLEIPWGLRTAIYMLGALIIGVAMAKILELPILRLRDRKFPSRSTGLQIASSTVNIGSANEIPARRAA
jgi:peptidoglycan/LPS O-acetylase OafA/YrhL